MGPRPALFMDRDGCLTQEVGYVNHPARLAVLPRCADAIRRLNEAGVPAVVVTNQAGIARGYFSAETLDAVHAELRRQLAAGQARLDGLYACVHHPREGVPPYRADCDCRKPRPGLFLRAARDLDLDLEASVMVGDKISDVEAGHAVGARAVLVRTGYGLGEVELRAHLWRDKPDHVADDLLDAVDWALAQWRDARRARS
jgi:D-glycero-D-manno-heptose 1,7-bisphosphate phosphatase